MAVKNPYDKYSNQSVLTASPEKLTLMLYDGALKFVNQGIAALDEKDYMKKNEMIQKAENIIRELQLTLKDGYEITPNLKSLYDYIYRRLMEGNMRRDKKALEEARDLIKEFRDMWREAMKVSGQHAS
ncbi:flagellar protein FliS [Clostridia bacterium]|nr:flagellar protein FliS [Clostridia bacterium]